MMDGSNTGVAADQLRQLIERIESLESEIRDRNADKSSIYQEAKSLGFDAKVMRKVIAARKLDHSERAEIDAIFDLYMSALGEA